MKVTIKGNTVVFEDGIGFSFGADSGTEVDLVADGVSKTLALATLKILVVDLEQNTPKTLHQNEAWQKIKEILGEKKISEEIENIKNSQM
jgi:hypothetical protein